MSKPADRGFPPAQQGDRTNSGSPRTPGWMTDHSRLRRRSHRAVEARSRWPPPRSDRWRRTGGQRHRHGPDPADGEEHSSGDEQSGGQARSSRGRGQSGLDALQSVSRRLDPFGVSVEGISKIVFDGHDGFSSLVSSDDRSADSRADSWSGPSSSASRLRPRWAWDFTEPRAMPSVSAMSASDRSR